MLGVMGSLIDVTDRAQAVRSLRRAHARLNLLERAASQIGTTLDIHRTAGELADLAVPELADRITVDLLDQVLQGEDPPRAGPGTNSGTLQFRRVVVRDAATRARVNFEVGDLIIAPVTGSAASAVWRGKPVLVRNPAEMTGQVPYTPGHAEALLARGVHTLMVLPLIARGVTLGVAMFARAERPEPYDEADVRLVSDLVSRAAVHIDNARLYTREHNTAVTLQRSLLPRDIPPVAGLQIAYRYQPASRAAEVGGDWFDVSPLDTGQVALVVGDVTGTASTPRRSWASSARRPRPWPAWAARPRRSCASSATWSPGTATRSAPPACTRCMTRRRGAAASPAPGTPRPRCAIPTAQSNSSTYPAA